MTDKDRINHLDEQCRSLLAEKNKLQAELSAFHAAMERERKADWEKWHNDLADRLENPSPDRTVAVDDARTAARELRYMADSFTLKANFVPTELKIKELEAALQRAQARLEEARELLKETKPQQPYDKDWSAWKKRRDAWLNPKEGE